MLSCVQFVRIYIYAVTITNWGQLLETHKKEIEMQKRAKSDYKLFKDAGQSRFDKVLQNFTLFQDYVGVADQVCTLGLENPHGRV